MDNKTELIESIFLGGYAGLMSFNMGSSFGESINEMMWQNIKGYEPIIKAGVNAALFGSLLCFSAIHALGEKRYIGKVVTGTVLAGGLLGFNITQPKISSKNSIENNPLRKEKSALIQKIESEKNQERMTGKYFHFP